MELCKDTCEFVSDFTNSGSSWFDLLPCSCKAISLDCSWHCLLLLLDCMEKQHLWLLLLSPPGSGIAVMEGDAAPLLRARGASRRKGHLTACPP